MRIETNMTKRAIRAGILLMALAGLWGGALAAFLLDPSSAETLLLVRMQASFGMTKSGLLAGGATGGLAVGLAVGIALVVTRRRWLGIVLAAAFAETLGVAFAVVGHMALTGTLPTSNWFGLLFTRIAFLDVPMACAVVWAAFMTFRNERGSSIYVVGPLAYGILPALGVYPFWWWVRHHVALEPGPAMLVKAVTSWALWGALFFAAHLLARRVARPESERAAPQSKRLRSILASAVVLVSLCVLAILAWTGRVPGRPYERYPHGKAFHVVLERLEKKLSAVADEAPENLEELALEAMVERWPRVTDARPLEGENIEAVMKTYVQKRCDLDPEWAAMHGFFGPTPALTRYRDEDLEARAALDVSLYRSLVRFPTDPDALVVRAFLARRLLADADGDPRLRSPAQALTGVHAVFGILLRDDLPFAVRSVSASSLLRQLPLVIDDFRSRTDERPKYAVQSAMAYSEAVDEFLDSLVETYPEEKDLVDGVRIAKEATSDYRGFLALKGTRAEYRKAVGMGRRTFRALLRAEGERRSLPELVAHAKTVVAESYGKANIASTLPMWRRSFAETSPRDLDNEELIAKYKAVVDESITRLKYSEIFPKLPEAAAVAVWHIPSFMASELQGAYYWPLGALTGPLGGCMLVGSDVTDGRVLDSYLAQLTTWHEAVPGHHLQFAIARLHAPWSRLVWRSDAYVEGWASYAATIVTKKWNAPGNSIVENADHVTRAAQAISFLEEIYLHTATESVDEALAYFQEVHGGLLSDAEFRLAARLSFDGYFSSYFLGREGILNARASLEKTLGGRFSEKWFHEELLKLGPVPPSRIVELLLPKAPE